ncbi:MAG TPA: response regulator, partial [Rhodospirillaceae bacterium]|nr:response regulator [Rhodospirillaceae bacterium]
MASKPRILFVDDEPNILESLRRMLRGRLAAWDMIFLDRPADALVAQRQQPFDVAVVDMRMPEMNGFELIAGLRSASATTVAIMLTG